MQFFFQHVQLLVIWLFLNTNLKISKQNLYEMYLKIIFRNSPVTLPI